MTEIFVSGTEVFSDAKMTETPYEWRRVDVYAMTAALPLIFSVIEHTKIHVHVS